MSKKMVDVLCGGTVFTLILQARKRNIDAGDRYVVNGDGFSEPSILFALGRIVDPSRKYPSRTEQDTLRTDTSSYKSCKNNGGDIFPFGNVRNKIDFDKRVKNDYLTVLMLMNDFVEHYIDIGGVAKKDITLVKALMDLIERDESIPNNQLFYIFQDGSTATKEQILTGSSFCFTSFILGIWHFAVTREGDNKMGADTYNKWCPPTGGGNRVYTGNLGERISCDIYLTSYNSSKMNEIKVSQARDENNTDSEDKQNEKSDNPNGEKSQQVINNTITLNVTGNNNNFFKYVDTVNIKNGE